MRRSPRALQGRRRPRAQRMTRARLVGELVVTDGPVEERGEPQRPDPADDRRKRADQVRDSRDYGRGPDRAAAVAGRGTDGQSDEPQVDAECEHREGRCCDVPRVERQLEAAADVDARCDRNRQDQCLREHRCDLLCEDRAPRERQHDQQAECVVVVLAGDCRGAIADREKQHDQRQKVGVRVRVDPAGRRCERAGYTKQRRQLPRGELVELVGVPEPGIQHDDHQHVERHADRVRQRQAPAVVEVESRDVSPHRWSACRGSRSRRVRRGRRGA